jgi:hypothetical protein
VVDDFDDLLDEIEPEADAPPVAEGQVTLFGSDDDFKVAYQEWVGMPEYVNRDLAPASSIIVYFRSAEDQARFHELIGVSPYRSGRGSGKTIWWPALESVSYADKRYRSDS